MPTEAGLNGLRGCWKKYVAGRNPISAEEKAWWPLFAYLKDIRPWSAKDRIAPIVSRYIEELLLEEPDRRVIVEMDLWFRASTADRIKAYEALATLISSSQAEVLDTVLIEEIQYHAVLVSVPARVARDIAKRHGRLAEADGIMMIRAQSSISDIPATEPTEAQALDLPTVSNKPCIGALIDGYPVAAHDYLNDRLVIIEQDVTGNTTPVSARYHGTAMASLILHGDLHEQTSTLDRRLAVVPVLVGSNGKESIPANKLPVGVIYRAIQALSNGTPDGRITQKQIVVVNHSICNTYAPFAGRPTPWAALLDHFGHKLSMLFVISAGNIEQGVTIAEFDDVDEFLSEEKTSQTAATMLAVEKARLYRNILSPAESVNALTVGALHADKGPEIPEDLYDPFPGFEMTSLCSAAGPGVNRAIKPDLVEAGGKTIAIPYNLAEGPAIRAQRTHLVGQKTAVPDPHSGFSDKVALSSGTSNAAALVTRAALQIADAVEEIYSQDDENWSKRKTRAVILKALVVHGCRWNAVAQKLDEVFPPADTSKWARRRAAITSLMGYGQPNVSLVNNGSANRITLLADDEITHGKLHEYRIPIPAAILSTREVRRIVITLAWSTPVAVASAAYRGMTVNLVNTEGKRELWTKVKRTLQPDGNAAERGTVTHLVLEGDTKTKFTDEKGLFLGVQARALSKKFEAATVPYALAVSIELASNQKSTVYEEVRTAIQNRTRARVGQQRT